MISKVGVELAERFSLQHDGEELARVIERARLVAQRDAYDVIGGGNPHTLAIAARAALARLDELEQDRALGTDFDLEGPTGIAGFQSGRYS